MNVFTVVSLLASASLVAACSSVIETSGQVFFDTSGSATKIAQVEIYVIPEDVLVKNLNGLMPTMKAEYERLKSEHQLMSDRSNVERLVKLEVERLCIDLVSRTDRGDCAYTVVLSVNERFGKLKASLAGLANGSNSEFFFPKAIEGSSVAATSDADGKFKLSLEDGKKVAVIGKKGDLTWFIWVTPKKGDQIYLTEKNSNGTQCDPCIFNKVQLASTFAFIPAAYASLQAK